MTTATRGRKPSTKTTKSNKTIVTEPKTAKSGGPRLSGNRDSAGGTTLVVVESPTKARTISAILGSQYQVMASKGHVADLPEKGLGYDETTFAPGIRCAGA